MNKRIWNAVKKIEKIKGKMGKDYQWENIEHIMIDETQYFDSHWEEGKGVPKKRALSDRQAMLEVLCDFYMKNSSSFEGRDDFITLFGVYCNHYIRYNLHKAIPDDKDFGIYGLFDIIKDKKMQDYLHLLQQGISKGIQSDYVEDEDGAISCFIDANGLLDEKYSLPNLYLFIYLFRCLDNLDCDFKGNHYKELRDYLMDCFDSMNKNMQNYCLGENNYTIMHDFEDNVDPNPLPYIKYKNEFEYECSKLLNKMTDSIMVIQNESSTELDILLAINNVKEAMTGFDIIKKNKQSNQKMLYVIPTDWRDNDGILYRLEFLSIPSFTFSNRPLSTIINNLSEVKKVNEKNELLMQDKQDMIRKFSHDFGNLETDTLHYMATKLLSSEDELLRIYGKQMMVEYVNKQDIIRSVYLLRLEFLDETQRLVDLIKQGITKCGSGNLKYLFDKAWERGFIRVLYTNNPLLNTEWGNKIISYQKEIEDEAFLGGEGITNWIVSKFHFNITAAKEWREIYFVSDERDECAEEYLGRKPRSDDGYGRVFFINMFSELFYNLLKYADWNKLISINMGYDKIESRYWIKIQNSKSNAEFHERKNGIATLDKTLTRINNESGYNVKSSIIEVDGNDTYQITISVSSQLIEGGAYNAI